MRFVLLLLSTLSFYSFEKAQNKEVEFVLSGTIYGTSVYYGGVEIDDSNLPRTPLRCDTICLISWTAPDSLPKYVKTITTDEKGEFKIKLPAGTYGFATLADLDSLRPGQWLPQPIQGWEGHLMKNISWQLSSGGPIDLQTKDVKGVALVRMNSTYCMDCP